MKSKLNVPFWINNGVQLWFNYFSYDLVISPEITLLRYIFSQLDMKVGKCQTFVVKVS